MTFSHAVVFSKDVQQVVVLEWWVLLLGGFSFSLMVLSLQGSLLNMSYIPFISVWKSLLMSKGFFVVLYTTSFLDLTYN